MSYIKLIFSIYQLLTWLILTLIPYPNVIPYMANILRGKTFAVEHKPNYSLENFHDASGQGHHVLCTASDSRRSIHDWLKNCKNRKSFPPQNI